jgi:hypothetical protein
MVNFLKNLDVILYSIIGHLQCQLEQLSLMGLKGLKRRNHWRRSSRMIQWNLRKSSMTIQ